MGHGRPSTAKPREWSLNVGQAVYFDVLSSRHKLYISWKREAFNQHGSSEIPRKNQENDVVK